MIQQHHIHPGSILILPQPRTFSSHEDAQSFEHAVKQIREALRIPIITTAKDLHFITIGQTVGSTEEGRQFAAAIEKLSPLVDTSRFAPLIQQLREKAAKGFATCTNSHHPSNRPAIVIEFKHLSDAQDCYATLVELWGGEYTPAASTEEKHSIATRFLLDLDSYGSNQSYDSPCLFLEYRHLTPDKVILPPTYQPTDGDQTTLSPILFIRPEQTFSLIEKEYQKQGKTKLPYSLHTLRAELAAQRYWIPASRTSAIQGHRISTRELGMIQAWALDFSKTPILLPNLKSAFATALERRTATTEPRQLPDYITIEANVGGRKFQFRHLSTYLHARSLAKGGAHIEEIEAFIHRENTIDFPSPIPDPQSSSSIRYTTASAAQEIQRLLKLNLPTEDILPLIREVCQRTVDPSDDSSTYLSDGSSSSK